MDRPKYFGIGLNKTGTTTLRKCGEILGLRCTGCDKGLLEDVVLRKDFGRLQEVVSRYDLFQDWPWPLAYEELDEMFPGSKFILTVRKDASTWLNSLKNHSMAKHPTRHCRKLAYGYYFPHRRQQEHLDLYRKHNADVRVYFEGRKTDFLELCWENGDGWQILCDFLDMEIPGVALPHLNKGKNKHPSNLRLATNRILSLTGM